jgi:hypothetical protein
LSKYVTDFLGLWNTSSIQFDEMVNANFNEWVMSLLVIINEVQDSDAKSYRKQEILKHYVDTSPIEIQVNVKHGFKGPAEICSSFLMFSNHTDALKTAVDDRRFTILRNTDVVDKSLTTEMALWRLNETDTPYNAEDLYRYFRQRVITAKLFEPLSTTAAEDMKTETKGVTEMVADAVAKACAQQDLIAVPATSLVRMYVQTFAGANLTEPVDSRQAYRRVSKLFFRPALATAMVRIGTDKHKPRLVKQVALGVDGVEKIRQYATIKMKSMPLALQNRIITDIKRFDEEATVAIAVDLLSD